MTTLVLSQRHSPDDQAVWRAAVRRGWSIERVRGISPPPIADPEIVVYAEALLAPVIAERLGRRLLDPPEDWLPLLPEHLKHREVKLTTLGVARDATEPVFVKPPNDKTFTAQVFTTGADLPNAFDDEVTVLVAEPVSWTCEYRCFCLDGVVVTLSPYLFDQVHAGENDYEAPAAQLKEATTFATEVLQEARKITPRAIVIDVGIIQGQGWAVVEANGAWGAGVYGCDPDGVLDVLRHATVPARPDDKDTP